VTTKFTQRPKNDEHEICYNAEMNGVAIKVRPVTARTNRVKVYSYGRISTKIVKQVKGRGKKRQDAAALKWCEEHGHTLESENCFFDRISGFKKHRNNAEHGELKVILTLIENGDIEPGSILLIESLDRLSRQSVNIAVQLLLQIINAGVVVVTLIDNATYRADANPHELMSCLMMSVAIFMRANDESRTKSARKGDSWQAKRELAAKGEYHGGKVPRWIEVIDGKYRVIEKEAKLISDVFNDYNNGLGLYRLNLKYGIPKGTISYWLKNPVVTGTLTVVEGDQNVELKNHYPAIIDMATWELAATRRAVRYVKRRQGAVGERPNIFSGLLYGIHGDKMGVSYHNGGTRNFVSRGCVIRCQYLEELICAFRLPNDFVRVREVEQSQPTDLVAWNQIESEMKKIQATMMEEPELASTLLPVLRKLQAKKSAMTQPSTVREAVNSSAIMEMLNDELTSANRLKLRELASQTIHSIRLTRVEGDSWRQMVSGVLTTTDDQVVPFRYAYHTRRYGFIMCDEAAKNFWQRRPAGYMSKHPVPVYAEHLTDEVKAELAKMPKTIQQRGRVVAQTESLLVRPWKRCGR
jgi:DNA invertase Pin-like site-specific DNA recombinase